jgi:predicted metal-binding membrane protein
MPKSVASSLGFDRALLLGGAAVVTVVAWLYMLRMAGYGPGSADMHERMTMGAGALFVMWAVMMVAMMLPSMLPFAMAFRGEQLRRDANGMPTVPTVFFVAGYFVIWTAFSAACAGLQVLLHNRALLSPMMTATSSVLSGAILIAAGVYQWTPMKNACLRHCRTPLTFMLSAWREGISGAFRMGAGHGLFCVGCCWMLMLLPFAAGVMNLLWMAGIAVLLLLEKCVPGGEVTARLCGASLAVLGVGVMYFGVRL